MRPSKAVLSFALALALAAPVAAQQQTAAPASQQSSGTAGTGRYDQQILQDVQKYLRDNDKWKDVQASVDDGIVTLTGTVDLYADKDRAGEKIRQRDRVAGVRNQIIVGGPSVPDAQLRDNLANKIKYDRIDQGQIFNNFALGVNNGVVTVQGETRTDVDKDSALSIVEKTPGVKDVVDQVKVSPTSLRDDELRVAIARTVYGRLGPNYGSNPEAPIRIVVNNGNVGLYGVVNSQVDKQVVLSQVRSINGVFNVDDHLVVANSRNESAAK